MRMPVEVNGFRGKFLLLHAVAFALIGYSYLVDLTNQTRTITFEWMPDAIPLTLLGIPWLAAAGVAIVNCLRYEVPRNDRWGFVALCVPPMLWSANFFGAWAFGPSESAWISAVTYGAMALIVMLAAGWPNPQQGG